MSEWPSTRARKVLNALIKIGWGIKSEKHGSHLRLSRAGFADFTWAFHEGVEIGPRMLARIAKKTGLTPDDL